MVEYDKRKFKVLEKNIRHSNRYIYSKEVNSIIDEIMEISKSHIIEIGQDVELYRCQVGCIYKEDESNYDILPYEKLRMFPRKNIANEGRANPKGIPYLYMATDMKTAMCEVRAWPGLDVSCCVFKPKQKLKLIDLTKQYKAGLIIDFKKNLVLSNDSSEDLWGEINNAFSFPILSTDNSADYSITQVIAEIIKNEGYDGLLYNSYFTKNTSRGKNIVLFDKDKVKICYGHVVEIKKLDIDIKQVGNTVWYE
ncbi:MAG: RES family NAD+ phosphorylase [Maledivibacter sp.]|jgi:hypothetical protein|nr:RES family NAD+ phosphorylase [Maledivibacter sp.]